MGLGRLPEAVGLWRELEAISDNDALVAMARERLQSYATKADRIVETHKVQTLVDEGQIEQAKILLLQAMLEDPNWDDCTRMLIHILKIDRDENGDSDMLDLENYRLSLEINDSFLDLVEQRLNEIVSN